MKRTAAMILGGGLLAALAVVSFIVRDEDKLQWQLTEAAGQGNLAEVKRLAAAGAKLDAFPQHTGTEGGSPALHEEVLNGHEDVVRFFVEHGANLEITFSIVDHLSQVLLADATTPLRNYSSPTEPA